MIETDTAFAPDRATVAALRAPDLSPVLPTSGLVAATAVVAWRAHGSLAAGDWLGLALLVALVLATAAAAGAARRPPAAVVAGAGSLLLLACWAATSIGWSASPAGARDEALLTGLYALALLVPALTLSRARDRRRAQASIALALGVLGLLTALKLALSADPAALLFGGRLDFPVSYVNGCSALFALGVWPGIVLAADRRGTVALRSAALGTSALMLGLAVAAQSKGTALGLGVSALVVFGAAPARLRLLAPALLAAAPAAVAAVALTAPYRSASVSVMHRAGWSALAVAAAGTALGGLYALADRRLDVGPARRRLIGRAVLALAAASALAALIAFVAVVHSPGAWASRTWTAFKHEHPATSASTHLTSLGSNRYDFWRVALDETRRQPLRGIGARSFYSAYLEHGRSAETPLRAHSLYLDTLAELGVPGLAALLVGLGAPLVLLVRRRAEPAAVAALGAAAYFVVHAAVDWIWTIPVVGLVALLLLGTGCGRGESPPLRRRSAVALAAAAAAVAALAFAPPWLAHLYVESGQSATAPGVDLSRARALDPLSLEPYWAAWRLAATPAGRAAALEQARRLEPRSVPVLFLLGRAYLESGRRADGVAVLRRAHALAPREVAVRNLLVAASR